MAMVRARSAAQILALAVVLVASVLVFTGGAQAAPGDIVFERKGGDPAGAAYPPSIFEHWRHRIRYRCSACHPALFSMTRGEAEMTMESMREGRYCGACHTGRIGFAIDFQSCARCHVAPVE